MEYVSEERLGAEMAGLRAEMSELRGELRAEMATLRAEMATLRGDLTAQLHRELRNQTWRLTGAVFVSFGLFATLVRLT